MQKDILTVTELNQAVRNLLEEKFQLIWVEGEISNLVCPNSGHLYFSLKDSTAQVRCAMFRRKSGWLKFQPKNGQHIRVRARVSVYPDRGDYQLIIESMEAAGEGALKRAYEVLVQKLAIAGIFQEKWKKPLPKFPKKIGVITSSTGAAIRDILSVLKRRFPAIPILIYPTLVQGSEAADQICEAIKIANEQSCCDIIILARGGGSIEDLWPFNEEHVAYAIFESLIPIVTGVGHEIDFTIADLVADVRAPTPSAAAELVVPLQSDLKKQFIQHHQLFIILINRLLEQRTQQLDWLTKRLRHPGQLITMQLEKFCNRHQLLCSIMFRIIEKNHNKLDNLKKMLSAVSPFATLDRGYAIISNASTGNIIQSMPEIERSTLVNITLADGQAIYEIKRKI